MTVAELLAQSKAAHAAYQVAANRPPVNYPLAEQHVARALDLRLQADVLDPQHLDGAWDERRWPHQQLVDFYRAYPSIP